MFQNNCRNNANTSITIIINENIQKSNGKYCKRVEYYWEFTMSEIYGNLGLQGGNLSIHAQKKPGDDLVKLAM